MNNFNDTLSGSIWTVATLATNAVREITAEVSEENWEQVVHKLENIKRRAEFSGKFLILEATSAEEVMESARVLSQWRAANAAVMAIKNAHWASRKSTVDSRGAFRDAVAFAGDAISASDAAVIAADAAYHTPGESDPVGRSVDWKQAKWEARCAFYYALEEKLRETWESEPEAFDWFKANCFITI